MGENDDSQTDDTQEPENDDQEPDGQPDDSASPDGGTGGDDQDDPVRDALRREQARNAKLQKKVEGLQDKLEASRGDESEELQTLREERAELESEVDRLQEQTRKQKIDQAIVEASQKHGLTRPDVVRKLTDTANIEINDDGEVVGATAEIERISDEYGDDMPGLFGRHDGVSDDTDGDDDAGSGTSDTSSPDSGSSKSSDRGGEDEPKSDEELAEALFEAGSQEREAPI